jgi:hypothetical protein
MASQSTRPARCAPAPAPAGAGARNGRPRTLNLPRAARVGSVDGVPQEVNGGRVEAVRESWLVEDRWWTDRPLRRRYWEIVSARGRNLVVFRDLCAGGWYTQG